MPCPCVNPWYFDYETELDSTFQFSQMETSAKGTLVEQGIADTHAKV